LTAYSSTELVAVAAVDLMTNYARDTSHYLVGAAGVLALHGWALDLGWRCLQRLLVFVSYNHSSLVGR
jgi:hypothetical protein